ncbi:DUF6172 family protein [Pontiella sp.]|uniref:DUF6172 family protein n=1 Tax=Pontiella sp. TaxID=2837462 RepID=UPI003566774D
MKKTFQLIHPKIKYPRMVEATKNELRKYIKRERRKELPEGADFWDFDCKFGDTEADAKTIHLAEIDACINEAESRELTSFYIEIIRKEGVRAKPERETPVVNIVVPKPKKFGEE